MADECFFSEYQSPVGDAFAVVVVKATAFEGECRRPSVKDDPLLVIQSKTVGVWDAALRLEHPALLGGET